MASDTFGESFREWFGIPAVLIAKRDVPKRIRWYWEIPRIRTRDLVTLEVTYNTTVPRRIQQKLLDATDKNFKRQQSIFESGKFWIPQSASHLVFDNRIGTGTKTLGYFNNSILQHDKRQIFHRLYKEITDVS